MLGLRKINPMVRAIGTMGAIAAVAGGVTFAALTSNTVALTDNTLSSASASLQIGSDNESSSTTSVKGISATLVPGTSQAFTFYLRNTGAVPLAISAHIPETFVNSNGVIPSDQITLGLSCAGGQEASFTLAEWSNGTAVIPGSIAAGGESKCSEKLTLNAAYSGSAQNIAPFTVQFTGNQVDAPTIPPVTAPIRSQQ